MVPKKCFVVVGFFLVFFKSITCPLSHTFSQSPKEFKRKLFGSTF